LATFALLMWPFLAILVFARLAVIPAVLLATFVPYLLLPEAFKIVLPGIPDLDKRAIISIGLAGGLIFYGARGRNKANLPELKTASRLFRFVLLSLVATILIGSILTVMNNREMLFFGPTVLPAMRPWDAVGLAGGLILFIIPFFIARRYLATPEAHRALLVILVISSLCYSFLMLIEIRLSPQLHKWVYGYFQHSFGQHIRDGYRPIVFLEHGLWVGFFIFMALVAAAALWKSEKDTKWLWAGSWIFIILMISKNLGAFAIGLMCLGVILGLWRNMQIWVVILIALTTLTYPALRHAELIPLEQILDAAESVSEDRAQSLEYRLRNEDRLLARAFEKPLTGWGSWSRDRIFNDEGESVAVSEGLWILTLGAWGWIGYVGLFGMLTWPLLSLQFTSRRKEIPIETTALALICAGNLLYLIPNATLTPIGLLCFGALAGFAQYDRANATAQYDRANATAQRLRVQRYSRFTQTAQARDAD
jgi:hypothetical protein